MFEVWYFTLSNSGKGTHVHDHSTITINAKYLTNKKNNSNNLDFLIHMFLLFI